MRIMLMKRHEGSARLLVIPRRSSLQPPVMVFTKTKEETKERLGTILPEMFPYKGPGQAGD